MLTRTVAMAPEAAASVGVARPRSDETDDREDDQGDWQDMLHS